MFYLSPTYWLGGDYRDPQPANQQQQPLTDVQQRTLGVGERALKGLGLLGLNVGTALIANVDLCYEGSWLGKQYRDFWNGYTIEQIPVEQREDDQQRALVPLIPTQEEEDQQDGNLEGALVPLIPVKDEQRDQLVVGSNSAELTEQGIDDSLVGRKFSVQLADGVQGEVKILGRVTTLYQASQEELQALQLGSSQLPMLEQQPSSGVLTTIWNRVSSALSGTSTSVPMRREQFHVQVRVQNIITKFRMSFQVPQESFTPNFMRSVVGNMMGHIQLPGHSDANLLVGEDQPRALPGVQQPLMIEGNPESQSRVVTLNEGYEQPVTAMDQIGIPRPLPQHQSETPVQLGQPLAFNPLFGGSQFPSFGMGVGASIYRGMFPFGQPPSQAMDGLMDNGDPVVVQEEVEQVERPDDVQREDGAGQNRNQRNLNIFQLLFAYWGARAQNGEFFRDRNVRQEDNTQNQSWYARLWAVISNAFAYVRQSVTGAYNNWWTTAAAQDTVHVNVGGLDVQVDILTMERRQNGSVFEEE